MLKNIQKNKVKVFVSGCFDILHAGHIQFFESAKALGDHLTVCFASDEVLRLAKGRESSMPEDNKYYLLKSIKVIDQVLKSSNNHPVLDFVDHLKNIRPDILAVTEDDKNTEVKRKLCQDLNINFVILKKDNNLTRTSTTNILRKAKNIVEVPLRVDFAGGWLDVPKFSMKGGYIVNCTISPLVSLESWPYEQGAGLGGSAAYSILQIKNGLKSELDAGVGWQDPAIIRETGLCVWRSGNVPVLDIKINPDWLNGKLLIVWTGKSHVAGNITNLKRDYKSIFKAGVLASKAVKDRDLSDLCKAVNLSYKVQLAEGMDKLSPIKGSKAMKYLGAGHGGYALYIFYSKSDRDKAHKQIKSSKIVEPYIDNKDML
jgi:cytidyltransferase-like protein